MTGVVVIMILLVAAVTVAHPLLKVIIYRKNPNAPDARNHFISALCFIFILANKAIISKAQDAAKYRRNPRENTEKYLKDSRVSTYASDQKTMVIAEYIWKLSLIFKTNTASFTFFCFSLIIKSQKSTFIKNYLSYI